MCKISLFYTHTHTHTHARARARAHTHHVAFFTLYSLYNLRDQSRFPLLRLLSTRHKCHSLLQVMRRDYRQCRNSRWQYDCRYIFSNSAFNSVKKSSVLLTQKSLCYKISWLNYNVARFTR